MIAGQISDQSQSIMFKTLAKELCWCRVDVDGEKKSIEALPGLVV